MQPCRCGHLRLGVAEIQTSLANGAVSFLPPVPVRKEAVQAWTIGEALDAGDFLEGSLLPEHGKQLFQKRIVTEETLPLEIFPRRLDLGSGLDEQPIFLPGALPVEPEVLQNPIHAEELRRLVESGGSPVAGPRIFSGVLDHPGPDGVEHDVPTEFQKIRLPVHQDGLEPPLQHMPYPSMPPVEGLRIDAVELAYGLGKIAIRCFEDQMKVIGHQTVSVTKHIEPAQRHGEN